MPGTSRTGHLSNQKLSISKVCKRCAQVREFVCCVTFGVHGFILPHFPLDLHFRAEAVFIQSYANPEVFRFSAHRLYTA